ncbi:hypothetical protein HS088_TW23G00201 [Tripterygium wilfordii]|uniref:Chaperonin-like RbcX protein n=1 Tax=Tripterygium wilfordii TaxID=458696 RepID=A0A7J7BU51_TRIWF|nr:chaperonin-like RbcX protein 2, chloroplastic [Tripterygium wilfordii]KAF5725479.1 hypothetical protein HS088_TW23G00201 [Tripterygium wilfordii]
MVGALSVVSSSVVDSHTNMAMKSCGELVSQRSSIKRKNLTRPGSLELGSSFLDSWHGWRLSRKVVQANWSQRRRRRDRRLVVVNELAGQYEDSFEDVKSQILNYFTYKAVRTVLNQLYEMNPTQYRWFYDFVVRNKPGGDGKRFIRTLGKEKHELAERVMVTRLHLYGKWVKRCNHAEIYQEICDENLALMRERLIETVIWPSDDSNTEKIG